MNLTRNLRVLLPLLLNLVVPTDRGNAATDLETNFLHPPPSARPWVYWFWLNGNITSNGITGDLEAMQRAGIGGVLIMEVDLGAPAGSAGFGTPPWREHNPRGCSDL